MVQRLQSLQEDASPWSDPSQLVPGLRQADVVEMAVTVEGKNVPGGPQSPNLDPTFGFVAVLRLAQGVDREMLLRQVLEAIEKKQPGLRTRLEESRTRIGAAEYFNVPKELFEEVEMPFEVGLAIGPGREGIIVGLGRKENLQDFLLGRTEGHLPGQINETLTRKGQVWIHFPVPAETAKNLAGVGPGMNENPMFAGLAQGIDQIREVSLSLNFGASQLDFSLSLGCADAAAANQVAGAAQGLIGMMQLAASQNPAAVPPFVGKIKAVAEGRTLGLTTALTMRDFDLAFQNINRALPAARTPGAGTGTVRISSLDQDGPPAPEPPPVEVEFVEFVSANQDSLRTARIRVQNRASSAVNELNLTFTYLDGAGRRMGQHTRGHSSLTTPNFVGAETTQIVDCLAFNVPVGTQRVMTKLNTVTFADGKSWDGKSATSGQAGGLR